MVSLRKGSTARQYQMQRGYTLVLLEKIPRSGSVSSGSIKKSRPPRFGRAASSISHDKLTEEGVGRPTPMMADFLCLFSSQQQAIVNDRY